MFSSSRARLNLAKVSNRIKSFEDVQRALQELEKIINELSKDVNKEAETETSDAVGKTGDIQTTRNADGSYTIEVKTKDGWKRIPKPFAPGYIFGSIPESKAKSSLSE